MQIRPLFATFCSETRGSVALLSAASAVAIVLAAGVGLDTLRAHNAKTAVTHITQLVCQRVADADAALYPGQEQRQVMGQTYARDQASRTSLDPKGTSFTIAFDAATGDVSVAGTAKVPTVLMRIAGFKSLSAKATHTCRPLASTAPPPRCSANALVFTNTAAFETAITNFAASSATDYVASVVSDTGEVRKKMVFGNSKGDSTVFLNNLDLTDRIVLQPFNADGSLPAQCDPGLPPAPPPSPPVAPPPPAPPAPETCSEQTLSDLAAALGKDATDDAVPNPQLEAMVSGTDLLTETTAGDQVPVPITPDFDSNAWSLDRVPEQIEWTQTIAHQIEGLPRPTAQGLGDVQTVLDQGGRLRRVISHADSIWVVNGVCLYVISPIAIDLTGIGRIETTGVTSERSTIPAAPGKTVAFDMIGNGKPVQTEWLTGNGQGLLVDNRDGMALQTMSGRRLFGSVGGFEHGYAKLSVLDRNGDAKLDHQELDGLAVWIDDGDAVAEAHELKTLAEAGITELSTTASFVSGKFGGKHVRATAIVNGKTVMTEDVWFNTTVGPAPQVNAAAAQ